MVVLWVVIFVGWEGCFIGGVDFCVGLCGLGVGGQGVVLGVEGVGQVQGVGVVVQCVMLVCQLVLFVGQFECVYVGVVVVGKCYVGGDILVL